MRGYVLPVAVLLVLASCGLQGDPGPARDDLTESYNVIQPPPTTPVFGCSASTNCATPFNGAARSCSGLSCSASASSVTCDGVTQACGGGTTGQCFPSSPAIACTTNAQCSGANCGGVCVTAAGCCDCR